MILSSTLFDNFHVKTNSKNYCGLSFSANRISFAIDIPNWVIFISTNYWSFVVGGLRSYYKAMLIYTIRISLLFIHCLISFPSNKCTKMKYNLKFVP